MGQKSVRGSYTVEAAFVVPLGIGVILFLIADAFFLHDRVAACAWVHEASVWEGFQKREEGNFNGSAGVLVTEAVEQTERDGREIMVTYKGDGRFLSSFAGSLFSLRAPHLEVYERVKRIYGEEEVRLRGFLEGVYTSGSDLQERAGT